jgi:NAD(P)-dependent dehydrogenase (short-subunit alcohol dehydrogenase family)
VRVLILGGTRFIGRRIALDLLARGDDVVVVHRGESEPDELSGCGHLHASRADFAGVAGEVRALRPDAVIDTRAMTRADASAVLPQLPDTHLVLLSSIDRALASSVHIHRLAGSDLACHWPRRHPAGASRRRGARIPCGARSRGRNGPVTPEARRCGAGRPRPRRARRR